MRFLNPDEPSRLGASRRRTLLRLVALTGAVILFAGTCLYALVAHSEEPAVDTGDGDCSGAGWTISDSLAPTTDPHTTFSDDEPLALSFSRDGSVLAVSEVDTVTLWDWRESRALARIDHDSSAVPPTPATFGPDGCLLSYGTANGAVVVDLQNGRRRVVNDEKSVRSVAFSPDGSTLALGVRGDPDGRLLHLHDTRTWELVDRLPGSGVLGSIRYSLDGSVVAGGEENGGVAVWDTTSGSLNGLIRDRAGVSADAFDLVPDGTGVLLIRSDAVLLVDPRTREVVREFVPGTDEGVLVDTAYSAASGRVFAARLDPVTGRGDMVAWEYTAATEVTLGPDLPRVFPMELSWDGSWVAGLRTGSGDVAVFDTELTLLSVLS